MFPELFNDRALIEFYEKKVRQALCVIGSLLREEDHSEELAEIEEWLMLQALPGIHTPNNPANEEIKQRRTFENLCVLMEDNGVGNPREQTVYSFYSRIVHLKNKNKSTK